MSSMPCTQVIKLADHSRFILQRLDQNLLLFIHSCTTKDNDFDIEYWKPWKCTFRFCSVRIRSRGNKFQLLSEFEKHRHNSNITASSTVAFLRKNQYFVEKSLYPSKMRRSAVSTPIRATSLSLPIEVDYADDNNGAVLKQLLLTGKEERRDHSKRTSSTPSPLISRTLSSGQQTSVIQLPPVGFNQHKKIPDFGRIAKLHVHVARATTLMWERYIDCRSPPILTPPPDGRAYSPPSTLVAHIEPYVEPQVMYNPYFLWQLYSYKHCGNSCNSFSQNI